MAFGGRDEDVDAVVALGRTHAHGAPVLVGKEVGEDGFGLTPFERRPFNSGPVPAPGPDLDAWADDHLFDLTGTGRTEGDAGYFVEIVAADTAPLVGRDFEWGT